MADPGLTVAFRFGRPDTGQAFDWDDNLWKASIAACTTPNLSATENTDFGDSTRHRYDASVNLGALNDTQDPIPVFVEAIEVADPVVSINEDFMMVAGGQWILWDLDGDLITWGGGG